MEKEKILVVGGAGYVGSALVPSLLEKGKDVTVYDTYWYGDVFSDIKNDNLHEIRADIRDREKMIEAGKGIDKMIHLACISNDPSFDLNPDLGKSINFHSFRNTLASIKENEIERLIYASSSSVYGIKEQKNVREGASPNPLTDYSKYKWYCEKELNDSSGFEHVIVRPATVCGYSDRLRLDVVVNILTAHAVENGKIKVFGGDQLRPNLNIKDMVRAYELLLEAPAEKVDREIFNIGYENYPVREIAEKVRNVVGKVEIETVPTDDNRSYHVNADKIRDALDFVPTHSIEDAVESISTAYRDGRIQDGLADPIYHNIKRMQELGIQ